MQNCGWPGSACTSTQTCLDNSQGIQIPAGAIVPAGVSLPPSGRITNLPDLHTLKPEAWACYCEPITLPNGSKRMTYE